MTVIPYDQLPRVEGNGEVDNTVERPGQRAPLILGGKGFTEVTETVTRINAVKTPKAWYVAFACSLSLLSLLGITIGYLVTTGVGVWGNNQPVSWGFDIVNFVFWVGIGHA